MAGIRTKIEGFWMKPSIEALKMPSLMKLLIKPVDVNRQQLNLKIVQLSLPTWPAFLRQNCCVSDKGINIVQNSTADRIASWQFHGVIQ
jgi:hypothetical protein